MATFALIPVLVIEADVESGGWLTVAYVANWVIWSLFAVELAAVLIVATRKKAALRAHWLDAAIVVLTVPLLGPVLSTLRLARFLRFARFAVILARALQAQRRITSGDALKIASLVTVAVVVVAGGAQSIFASGEFGSLWDGIWWATTTITTVGYGDIYPKTTEGRLIGIVVMVVGIAAASVLTATIASKFVRDERESETSEILQILQRLEADVQELKTRLS
ncbi:MAG: potassium channel family protein [Gaiellaceae bacterium]